VIGDEPSVRRDAGGRLEEFFDYLAAVSDTTLRRRPALSETVR
jgi:hypothetical protein